MPFSWLFSRDGCGSGVLQLFQSRYTRSTQCAQTRRSSTDRGKYATKGPGGKQSCTVSFGAFSYLPRNGPALLGWESRWFFPLASDWLAREGFWISRSGLQIWHVPLPYSLEETNKDCDEHLFEWAPWALPWRSFTCDTSRSLQGPKDVLDSTGSGLPSTTGIWSG